MSNPKNVPYYYQCHRFSLTGAFLCLKRDTCSQSYWVNLLKLKYWDFLLETKNPTQVLEPGLATGAYKLTSLLNRGSESGSLESTAMLEHNSGSYS